MDDGRSRSNIAGDHVLSSDDYARQETIGEMSFGHDTAITHHSAGGRRLAARYIIILSALQSYSTAKSNVRMV